jgi:hypothetical protein
MFVLMNKNQNIIGCAPALTVRKAHFGKRFYYWLGASGERYLHTVFAIDADFYSPGANLMIVRHEPSGERFVLFVGRVGQLSAGEIDRLRLSQGANEQHIHLMATGDAAIDNVAADLSRRHLTHEPACRKPLPAVFFANVSF